MLHCHNQIYEISNEDIRTVPLIPTEIIVLTIIAGTGDTLPSLSMS